MTGVTVIILSCGSLPLVQPICGNFTDDGDPANGPCGSGCLCSPAIQQGGLTLDTCNATQGLPGYGYCSHSGELYSEVGASAMNVTLANSPAL